MSYLVDSHLRKHIESISVFVSSYRSTNERKFGRAKTQAACTRVFPQPFRVLSNFNDCFYISKWIETSRKYFLLVLEHATRKGNDDNHPDDFLKQIITSTLIVEMIPGEAGRRNSGIVHVALCLAYKYAKLLELKNL